MTSTPQPWIFEAGRDNTFAPLVLLHGSFGSESDLLPMANRLAPSASRLGVRGTVAMGDGYAFFRRHPNRRVDEADLRSRVPMLAALIAEFSDSGQLVKAPVLVGFSNGAIMAAALVATYPEALAGAILLRPLSPFTNDASYRRSTIPVLIIDGAEDRRRSAGDGHRLAAQLRRTGAVVSHEVLPVGHSISAEDERLAGDWLRALP